MSKGAADTQTSSIAVGGGNSNFVAASGNLGSSSLSAYPGPWYIETQTLNIDYVRVPFEQYWNNTCDATLSGLTTTHGNIHSTGLQYKYTATYDAAIVYQNFNSSSVQQAQEFTILAASGDPNGIRYGALSSTTLGPMGSIVTTKAFIRRTPYTGASSQQAMSKVSTGASFGIYDTTTSASRDGTSFFTDLNFWSQLNPYNPDPVGNASTRTEGAVAVHEYSIPGAYRTNKELLPLSVLIDNISYRITNEHLFTWPIPTAAPSTSPNRLPVADEGLPEYDKNRHA